MEKCITITYCSKCFLWGISFQFILPHKISIPALFLKKLFLNIFKLLTWSPWPSHKLINKCNKAKKKNHKRPLQHKSVWTRSIISPYLSYCFMILCRRFNIMMRWLPKLHCSALWDFNTVLLSKLVIISNWVKHWTALLILVNDIKDSPCL